MVDIGQVLHKGMDSTTITHQRTTSTNTGPLVFGPQSRDVIYRPTFSFAPSRPLGSDLCRFCLVYPLRVGYHCVLGGSIRGGPCLFLVPVCMTFCLLLRHLGPRFSLFPSFLFPPFNSSCVDPGHSNPQVPHFSRTSSIFPVYAFGFSLHPYDLNKPNSAMRTD